MRKGRTWAGVFLLLILVLAALLVPLITLPRAKAGILRSLQASLGRRIQAQAVHLELLPRPGVELDDVRLADSPAFGLEAMVMADSATASLSLWGLLRGRIVFSRIHLESPSINLVRNDAGRWNLAALLECRGCAGGSASVGRLGASARFPYIDWNHARVNFKFHQTKTHFYLDQVSGSLARERSDWRLQLRFVPARSDLNLSNTGVVTLDGHWAAGGPLPPQFDLVLHLRDSYLAGSSALLFGHDAGVHGVLSAVVRLTGSAQAFSLTGSVSAVSVRRWDLLPSPARVSFAFAARYVPGRDELQIQGVGDPGWRHVRLAGTVGNVFGQPRLDLHLQLQDFSATNLLPLALALKSDLPADLSASGTLNGAVRALWQVGQGLPQGSASLRFTRLRLASAGTELALPTVALSWRGQRLRLPAISVVLRGPGPGATILHLSGELGAHGFALQCDSPLMTADDSAALSHLLGVKFPWPAQVEGKARFQLRLTAPWSHLGAPQSSVTAVFARARFQPPGSAGVELAPLQVSFGPDLPFQARFHLAALPVLGALTWTPQQGVRFQLTGQNVPSAGVWALLHPAPGDLMQRMFGAILGAPAPPPWLRQLRAGGTVRLAPLLWHGIAAQVILRVQAAPGSWRAEDLNLLLGGGEFRGTGALAGGDYEIHGAVPAARALALLPLLRNTPFHGLLLGHLSGALTLTRPLTGGDLRHLDAHGDFLLRSGTLRTASGPWRFQSCRGQVRLHQGAALLTDLDCLAAGRRFHGSGQAQFAPPSALAFNFFLHDALTTLHLLSPPPAAR
ncbi:MAG: AsmA family protein [Terriglobales bacterium]